MFGADYVKRVAVLDNDAGLYVCESCLLSFLEENDFINDNLRRACDGQNDEMSESEGWGQVRFITSGSEKLTEIVAYMEEQYEDGLYCDICSNEIFEAQDEDEENETVYDGEEFDSDGVDL